MEQTKTRSTCFISGHVRVQEQERVVRDQDVSARGTSLMTVGSAKNEAIEGFTRAVLEVLDKI